MYLFSRQRRAAVGRIPEAMGWAVETAGKVTQMTGVPVSAWASMWGTDTGTIAWTAFVDDLAGLEQLGDKLAADSAWGERIREAESMFPGVVEDQLAQVVHGTPSGDAATSQYVSVVRAELTPGHLREGLEGAVEIAATAERIAGKPTLVALSTTGRYGGLAWLTAHADVQALQATGDALNGDPSFLALVDRVSHCYLPNAEQAVYRRLV